MHRKKQRISRRRTGLQIAVPAVLAVAAALFFGLAGSLHTGNIVPDEMLSSEELQGEKHHAGTVSKEDGGRPFGEAEQSDGATEALLRLSEETETAAGTAEAFAPEDAKGRILSLSAGEVVSSGMVEDALLGQMFFASELTDEIFARMDGISYTQNENIQRADLSYLRMLYWDGSNTCVGEMVVNQKIKEEVLAIFQTLYENRYPIEKMVLIDNYGGDDEASMQDNNTSAFNYRTIAGSDKLSNHSYGMAIDLNPKYNPYVKTRGDGSVFCQPQGSESYADRMGEFAYKIDENDLAYQLFTQAGFTWGGHWNSVKDYQHFEWEE